MKKQIFLFLDDDAFSNEGIRNPEKYYPLIGADFLLEKMKNYEVVKFTSVEDAQDFIEKNGCPHFISFDNDLQRQLEGIDLAKWLVEKDLDNPGFFPENFEFFVHSQNIKAAPRIYSLLNQYLEMKEKAVSMKPKF
jgi:hypothetical protein